MLGSEFYRGQGFGNQLWVYWVVRSAALRTGQVFGFLSREEFKGQDFLKLNMGVPVVGKKSNAPAPRIPNGFEHYYREKQSLTHPEKYDVTRFDPQLFNPKPNTFLDGYMQSEKYIEDNKDLIKNEMKFSGEIFDGCTIHFRAGDYLGIPDVLLPPTYYYSAMEQIKNIDPTVKFRVVTDGPRRAQKYFPNLPILSSGRVLTVARKWYFQQKSSNIGIDFSRLQNSKYLILSNSSFSWWGAWSSAYLVQAIAPKYWARFNTSDGYWGLGDSLTKSWIYIDRNSKTFTYEQCLKELNEYRKSGGF